MNWHQEHITERKNLQPTVRLRAVQNRQPPLRQIPSGKARKKRRATLRRPPRSQVKANHTTHTSRQLPRNPFFLFLCLLKTEFLVSSYPLLESHLRRLARDLRPSASKMRNEANPDKPAEMEAEKTLEQGCSTAVVAALDPSIKGICPINPFPCSLATI